MSGKTTSALRKKLYNAVRQTIAPAYQSDTELVKIRRDAITEELYGNRYDQLNDLQLVRCINHVGKIYEKENPDEVKKRKPATPRQLRLLKFFALKCALYYANYEDLRQKTTVIEKLTAAELKNELVLNFESKKGLPSFILRYMFDFWINPKSNQFMVEGGFKTEVKNPSAFVYEYLTNEQAQALITRFEKISSELSKTKSVDFTNN